MKNKVCFIPARNNSKRFKNKNIQEFENGNLITHTINQALESNIFNQFIVSSNDINILNNAEKHSDFVQTHLRDDKHDQLLPVIRNAILDLDLNHLKQYHIFFNCYFWSNII